MQPLLDMIQTHILIESRRLQRAREQFDESDLPLLIKPGEVSAVVKGHYKATIATHPEIAVWCDCPDWTGQGARLNRACKHILALALISEVPPNPSQSAITVPVAVQRPEVSPFGRVVAHTISTAVSKLALEVQAVTNRGLIPFLIGPTGSAKTSSVRQVATTAGWGFEEITGSDSFADADLVGVRMSGGVEIPGIFARAFQRAREDGEVVLLFLDEFLRFNSRAQDILLRPFLPIEEGIARAMQIPATEPVYLIEAPLWGREWAPTSRVRFALAGNPWGTQIDPALIRRVEPLFVEFDQNVADLFHDDVKTAIVQSWQAVQRGELPLPIEYGALINAQAPDDTRIILHYLHRLRALDQAAAEGFRTLLEGQGIRL